MKNFRSLSFHFIYIVLITVLFSVLLFPSETVSRFVENRFQKNVKDMTVAIGKTGLAFPPGLTFREVILSREEEPLVSADKIRLTPVVSTLFAEEKQMNFDGRLCSGRVFGIAGLTEGQQDKAFDAEIEGVRIGEIEAFANLTENEVSGLLSGKVSGSRGKGGQKGKADFTISDLIVGMQTPLLGISGIRFTGVDAEMEMEGQSLIIKKFVGDGPQAAVNLSGTILLRRPADKSILNLKGTIEGRDETMKTMIRMLMRNPAGEFTINGSLEHVLKNPAAAIRGR